MTKSSWTRRPLEQVATVIRGITFAAGDKVPEGTPGAVACLRTSNVQETLEVGDLLWVDAGFVRRPDQWLAAGDTLISMANSYQLVGKVAFNQGHKQRMSFGGFIAAIRPRAIQAKYLYFALKSPAVQTVIRRGASQTVNISNIGAGSLNRVEIPVAPSHEQPRIVVAIETHFSRLDAAVAALTRAKANVKRARASVLKAAVEGRLVPTEAALARSEGRAYEPASVLLERILAERRAAWAASGARGKYQEPVKPAAEGLAELPEGWGWASFDQLTTLITSGSRGWAEHYADAGPIFIRSQDINTYRLQLSGVAHVSLPQGAEGTRTRVMAGDVLVIITGANVTVCARVSHDIGEAYVSQHVGLCRPVATATSAYAHLWLRAEGGGRTQLQAAAYGAGKPGLNLPNIRNVVVGLPPSHEQHRIVAEVDRRLSVLDALDRSIDLNLARCARLRQAVLKRAFEGRLVPAETPVEATAAPAASAAP